MRHREWDRVCNVLLPEIAERYGATIHDSRCGKPWDTGQAICAEAYGPDWGHDPVFLEWNQKGDDLPPEPGYMAAAERLAYGDAPEWIANGEKGEQ